MRLRSARNLALAFLATVAACSDSPDTAPAPTASAIGTPNPSACDMRTIKALYFFYMPAGDQVAAKNFIFQMSMAGTQTPAGRNHGFDFLALIASRVGQARGTPAQGSQLVNALLQCMFPASDLPATFPVDFAPSLDPAVDGAFAVRGPADANAVPVLSRGAFAFSGVAPPPDMTWPNILSERVLIYGKPTRVVPTSENPVGDGYDWSMIRHSVSFGSPGAVVGICVESGGDILLGEEGVGILAFVDPTYFLPCPNLIGSVPGSRGRGVFALMRSILTPRALHAAPVVNPGGTGGLAGGLRSVFGAVAIGELTLQFTIQASDTRAGQTMRPVEIRAKGGGGTPMAGVLVSLVARRSDGSLVELSGTTQMVTGADGKVTFTNLSLTDVGTYNLVVTGSVRSFTDEIQSVTFQIKP